MAHILDRFVAIWKIPARQGWTPQVMEVPDEVFEDVRTFLLNAVGGINCLIVNENEVILHALPIRRGTKPRGGPNWENLVDIVDTNEHSLTTGDQFWRDW